MEKLNVFERKLLAEIALASKGCGTHESREELLKAYKSNALTDELVMKAVPNAYKGVVVIKEKISREGWKPGVNEPVFMYFNKHNAELKKQAEALREKIAKVKDPAVKKELSKALKSVEKCCLRVEKKGKANVLMHGEGVVKKVGGNRLGPLAIINPRKRKR